MWYFFKSGLANILFMVLLFCRTIFRQSFTQKLGIQGVYEW